MTKLKALCHVYEIIPFAEKSSDCRGRVNYEHREICIDTRLTPVRHFETMLHEIVHLVKYINGDTEQNEGEVIRFATTLTTILLENPDLLKMAVKASAALEKELQ